MAPSKPSARGDAPKQQVPTLIEVKTKKGTIFKPRKIKCGICGNKCYPATPLMLMCYKCYSLYNAAISPRIEMSGHPANATYYRSPNQRAIETWFAHMRKHGFVQKRGKWIRGSGERRPLPRKTPPP